MPSHTIAGPAAAALRTLTISQVAFIESLPKAELHAHLNGSIPIPVLQELALEHSAAAKSDEYLDEDTRAGLERLQTGTVVLGAIQDFFELFPAIYELTSTPDSLARATRGVLGEFLDGETPQCTYIELRTTPRETPFMSRSDYIRTVLDEVEKYPARTAALIVSLDRRMDERVIEECVEIVRGLKAGGRRVVGVDLCGDPTVRYNLLFFFLRFKSSLCVLRRQEMWTYSSGT
jgi:adenosine deaminase